jgi:hypothetical protein
MNNAAKRLPKTAFAHCSADATLTELAEFVRQSNPLQQTARAALME